MHQPDHDDSVARPRSAAGVLFFDEADRVLLVKPTYKEGWEIPGGYLRPGESPGNAAAREVREELGVVAPVGRLLVVDWAPNPGEGDKLLFVFDGGVLPASTTVVVDGVEIGEHGYFSDKEVDDLLIPRLARRVHAAIACRSCDTFGYLENGVVRSGRVQ